MKEQGHLSSYEIILTAKSPVYIGSGTEYNKKEYYYDRAHNRVHIINMPALLSLLHKRNLADEYESYMLYADYDLCEFFRRIKITSSELNELTEYTADVGDALVANEPLAAINQFIRDAKGRPYIPGSSLKGCLRTAILWKMISEDKSKFSIDMDGKLIEKKYLNILNLMVDKPASEINDIMRGISISDSDAIDPNRIILTKKIDISVNGISKDINSIREAIAPNTTVRFIMTIDRSVPLCPDINYIRSAISEYGSFYNRTFQKSFHLPQNSVQESFDNCLVIGGGSGYFGKNIVYPALNKQEAVRTVAYIMTGNARTHNHERDIALGISPRKLKHTKYQNRSYHYGVCHIEIR